MKERLIGSHALWLNTCFILTCLLTLTTSEATRAERQLRRRDAIECQTKIDDDTAKAIPTNSSANDPPNNWSVTLTRKFAERAVVAAELSFLSFEDDISSNERVQKYRTSYDEFHAWADVNDVHLLVKDKGVCYGVFRGTFQPSLTDNLQNLYPTNKEVPGTNCKVRKGFYRAYFTSYVHQFELKVAQCVRSCIDSDASSKEEGCPLVLTGHSQGAAVAIVASLSLKTYNPTTIAFGPLRTITNLQNGCTSVNSKEIYSLINASGGFYDGAPYGFGPYGQHVGQMLLLDEEGAISYTGTSTQTSREPTAQKLHAVELYRTRMRELYDPISFGSLPRAVTQWNDGHWCTLSDECSSNYCSRTSNTCTPKVTENKKRIEPIRRGIKFTSGTSCIESSECESGKCFQGACTLRNGKLGIGALCTEDNDCASQRCDASGNNRSDPTICSPLRDVGMWCKENS